MCSDSVHTALFPKSPPWCPAFHFRAMAVVDPSYVMCQAACARACSVASLGLGRRAVQNTVRCTDGASVRLCMCVCLCACLCMCGSWPCTGGSARGHVRGSGHAPVSTAHSRRGAAHGDKCRPHGEHVGAVSGFRCRLHCRDRFLP